MQQTLLALLVAALVFAAGPVAAGPAKTGDDFGGALTLDKPTPLADVLANPERWAEQPVLVHGKLTDVCQRKGCWTVIQDGGAQVRVRFKDYGFFLPKDATGREAFVQGVVVVETLSESQARHYESESRHGNPDAVKGPQRHVGFTASGVRLVPK